MKYKTKVTFKGDGKTFPPGAILPDNISKADLAFLKMKGFVELVDASPVAYDGLDGLEDEVENGLEGFGGFDEMQPGMLKSPEEIYKIRSKKEVAAYAAAIGFDLGENYGEKSLKDLQESVVDFQQEQMESGSEGE